MINHLLQIRVLQIHVLQIQSVFYNMPHLESKNSFM